MSTTNFSPEDNIKLCCKIIRKLLHSLHLIHISLWYKENNSGLGGRKDPGEMPKLLAKLGSKEVKEYQFEEREDLSDKVIFEQKRETFEGVRE